MDSFKKLPESLFDSILQYVEIKDIINFKNTSKEHNEFVKKITTNKNSKVVDIYNIQDICNVETWISLPFNKYNMKFVKQYYDIYKNIGNDFYLEFNEIKNIFLNLSHLIKNIYKYDTSIENNEKYKYIVMILFRFISNNSYIFHSKYEEDIEKEIYHIKEKILNVLFRLYLQDLAFLTQEEFTQIEAYLIDIYGDLLNKLDEIAPEEKEDYFISEYLQLFLINSDRYNSYKCGYLLEIIEDMIIDADIGHLFFLSDDI